LHTVTTLFHIPYKNCLDKFCIAIHNFMILCYMVLVSPTSKLHMSATLLLHVTEKEKVQDWDGMAFNGIMCHNKFHEHQSTSSEVEKGARAHARTRTHTHTQRQLGSSLREKSRLQIVEWLKDCVPTFSYFSLVTSENCLMS
jgi:hypothetical protein